MTATVTRLILEKIRSDGESICEMIDNKANIRKIRIGRKGV
jgi:hypothetical protein